MCVLRSAPERAAWNTGSVTAACSSTVRVWTDSAARAHCVSAASRSTADAAVPTARVRRRSGVSLAGAVAVKGRASAGG